MLGLLLVLLIGLELFYNYYWKRRGLPPGPAPLPLLGNWHDFSREPPGYATFARWAKQYGPIYTYWQGEQPLIAVNGFDLTMETFVKYGDATSDRQAKYLSNYSRLFRGTEERGFFSSFGQNQEWAEHRRFAMQQFRKHKFGEPMITAEVENIIEKLQNQIDAGIEEHDVSHLNDAAIGSVIHQILFGYRFSDDKLHEYYQLRKWNEIHFGLFPSLRLLVVLFQPEILKHVPWLNEDYSKLMDSGKGLYEFWENQIHEHQERHKNLFNNDSNVEDAIDYVDAFLRQRQRNLETTGDEGAFSLGQLRAFCFDLWLAPQLTATQITYDILMLIRHPNIQQKMQEELDRICGKGRVEMQHKIGLPYTNAVVTELRRVGCFAVHPAPARQTRIPLNIGGHIIPAGIGIHPVFSSVLYDETLFPEPEKFMPERWLTNDDDKFNKPEYMIGFSIGKRMCLGEQMSKIMDFLIVANMVHEFEFHAIDPTNPPSDEKTGGPVVFIKEKFKCRVIPRIS